MLVFQSAFVWWWLNFGCNEIFFHSFKHMLVSVLCKLFLFCFIFSFIEWLFKHFKFLFHFLSWNFSLYFLYLNLFDFFSYFFKFLLFLISHFFSFIMLFFYLLKLKWNLHQLFRFILIRSWIISWFKKSCSWNIRCRAIINFEFLSHYTSKIVYNLRIVFLFLQKIYLDIPLIKICA